MDKLNMEEIMIAFKSADKDGNGQLTAKELKAMVKTLTEGSMKGTKLDQVTSMFMNMADQNGDKMVNYEELVETLTQEEPDEKEMARAMFKMFDNNGDGKLSKKELIKMSKSMESGSSDGGKILGVMADEDGDGKLSFKEYCALMNIH